LKKKDRLWQWEKASDTDAE